MTIAKFNYTNRQRILREDARITINKVKDGYSFDVGLNLESYKLPPEAHIYVEPSRLSQYMRFDFGQVGARRVPSNRLLTYFGSIDGIKFRVKVVKGEDPSGLLLAVADQITPRESNDEDENRMPLLPVDYQDIGDEIWQISLGEEGTLLIINKKLTDYATVGRDPMFLTLVYPAVLRVIFDYILIKEKYNHIDDSDNWRSQWLQFAVRLPGVSDPPDPEMGDEDATNEWINSVVSSYSRRHSLLAIFEKAFKGVK